MQSLKFELKLQALKDLSEAVTKSESEISINEAIKAIIGFEEVKSVVRYKKYFLAS